MNLDFKREVALVTLHPIISNVNDKLASVKNSKLILLINYCINREKKKQKNQS